jgi:maltose O-acetyltransferase
MNELEKMRNGLLADFTAPDIQESFRHCKTLLAKFRMLSMYDDEYRTILEELIPGIPKSAVIMPPFHCDHGNGIRLGEHVFINANCTFLDGAFITIGAHTLIGPNVQIYTPHHPLNYQERREGKEYSYPVSIGSDCWIGGGSIILPGITIGDRTVIGAGSVVTKDIPSDCVAVGNPAVVKKRLL